MSVRKIPGSPYYQIRFQIAGTTVERSSRTRDKRAAEELERQLKDRLWRQAELGEDPDWEWEDARAKFVAEQQTQKSWDRTQECLTVLDEYLAGELLKDIDYEAILELRAQLSGRVARGNGRKRMKAWSPATVNRHLAVLSSMLKRCASQDWKYMLKTAPNVPLLELPKKDGRWITREQAQALLFELPPHLADLARLALATGLRKSNLTHLEWARIDLQHARCHIEGYRTKAGEPIPVPLNADALAVIERWRGRHPQYVFTFKGRAPIGQVATKAWTKACARAGIAPGFTFHMLRHSWASWHVQAGTPLRVLQDLGGWADLQMPQRYAHLNPGHIAQYANSSLLGDVKAPEWKTGERGSSVLEAVQEKPCFPVPGEGVEPPTRALRMRCSRGSRQSIRH